MTFLEIWYAIKEAMKNYLVLYHIHSLYENYFLESMHLQLTFKWSLVSWTPGIYLSCPVGWGWRMHWLHLSRGVRPPPLHECPGYNTKQSDGEVPVMLGPGGMQSTPLLPLLPGLLWPGIVAPDRALSMGWIELTAYLC